MDSVFHDNAIVQIFSFWPLLLYILEGYALGGNLPNRGSLGLPAKLGDGLGDQGRPLRHSLQYSLENHRL